MRFNISLIHIVVVPGYYLVWYNGKDEYMIGLYVVVPGYYLVWYNSTK